ncbi:MAG: hypothetical protein QOF83_2177 [Solirubrobacteraceae bacterium]|jgi:hypothetical protein|nr:hypothetical protein [Solirubrobacteraceae bacterium]
MTDEARVRREVGGLECAGSKYSSAEGHLALDETAVR